MPYIVIKAYRNFDGPLWPHSIVRKAKGKKRFAVKCTYDWYTDYDPYKVIKKKKKKKK
jgi:hypothetical protein